jgi:hypothetical protein
VKRSQRAFQITGLTWIVERTFAWLGRNRRLSKDYEYCVQTSETMIDIAAIRSTGSHRYDLLKHPLKHPLIGLFISRSDFSVLQKAITSSIWRSEAQPMAGQQDDHRTSRRRAEQSEEVSSQHSKFVGHYCSRADARLVLMLRPQPLERRRTNHFYSRLSTTGFQDSPEVKRSILLNSSSGFSPRSFS